MGVITIARELGSGGDEIGARVAEALGYEYVDRRLITDIAHLTGSIPEEVERLDEKGEGRVRFFLKRLLVPQLSPTVLGNPAPAAACFPEFGVEFASLADPARAPAGPCLDRGTYQLLVTTLIQDAGSTGRSVIVGRASQIILRGLPGAIHAKVTAPFGVRVERIMAERGVAREAAAQLVAQHDRWRKQYLANYHGVDWDDPLLYDLVLNTARIATDEAVAVLVELSRQRHARASLGAAVPKTDGEP